MLCLSMQWNPTKTYDDSASTLCYLYMFVMYVILMLMPLKTCTHGDLICVWYMYIGNINHPQIVLLHSLTNGSRRVSGADKLIQ